MNGGNSSGGNGRDHSPDDFETPIPPRVERRSREAFDIADIGLALLAASVQCREMAREYDEASAGSRRTAALKIAELMREIGGRGHDTARIFEAIARG